MKYVAIIFLFLSGCGSLPTFKYCDRVEYIRNGNEITINAHCNAPIGSAL